MGPRQSESFGGVGGEAGDRRGSNKSQNGLKGQFSSMPVLEDGLSSGQSSVGSGDECSGGGGVSSASVTSASDTEEDAVTDRIPLMADRQRRTKPPLSVHPLHSAVNNGCRNLAGSSPLQSSSSVTGLSGTRPSSKTTTSSHQQQQQQPSPLWVKKMSTNNSDCDHIHRHHQEPAMIQGSFRKSAACPSSDSWFLLPNMFSYCVGFPPPLRTLFFLFSWNVTHRYFSLFVSFFSFFSLLILARTILGFPLWRRSWLTFRSSVVSRWFIFFLIFLFFFSFRWFISVHSAGFDAVVFFFSFCVLFVDAFLIRLRFFFAVGLLLCAGLVRIASPTSIFSSSLPFHRSHLSYTHTYIYYFFFCVRSWISFFSCFVRWCDLPVVVVFFFFFLRFLIKLIWSPAGQTYSFPSCLIAVVGWWYQMLRRRDWIISSAGAASHEGWIFGSFCFFLFFSFLFSHPLDSGRDGFLIKNKTMFSSR